MDWRAAFLAQARADFAATEALLARADIPRCELLHCLQMTLEKLAKGMSCPAGGMIRPPKVHSGATRIVQYLIHGGPHASAFQTTFRMSDRQRNAYLRELLPAIVEIERLAPALAGDGPNAEYPWAVPHAAPASVMPPSDYDFPIPERDILRLMHILRILLANCS